MNSRPTHYTEISIWSTVCEWYINYHSIIYITVQYYHPMKVVDTDM